MPRRALGAALLTFLLVSGACRPNEAGIAPQITQPAVRERAVTFRTSDGLTLHGRLFGEGTTGVALAHMFPADATSWYPAARVIADAGYVVLAFDFRGFADSQGDQDPSQATDDLAAAVTMLRSEGARAVALAGASMGGTAALQLAATRVPAAVIALSPPTHFKGLDALTAVGHIRAPVLLMAAQGDGPAFESLQVLAGAMDGEATRVFDGDAHGTNMLSDRPEALEEIIGFLGRVAPPGGASDATPLPLPTPATSP
jgi:hypothetical protein